MIVTVYQHPNKDSYGRMVFDYTEAAGHDTTWSRFLLKRCDLESAKQALTDILAFERHTHDITLEFKEKFFTVF